MKKSHCIFFIWWYSFPIEIMILEDKYAGLCMEVKSLQRQLTEAEKRATERWHMYDAERQNHNITKKNLRMAIDALEYYLDNGDCHNAITRAENAIKAIVLPQSICEQAGLSEPPDVLSNTR